MAGLQKFLVEDSGADAVEYALVIAFIALAIVAGATTMGTVISNKLSTVAGHVTSCPTSLTSC